MARIYMTGIETGSVAQFDAENFCTADNTTTRGSWSAYSVGIGSGGGVTDQLDISTAEFYCGYGFRVTDPTLGDSGMGFASPNAVEQVRMVNKTGGQLHVVRGSTELAAGTTVLAASTWYYIEVYLKIDASAGALHVYLDGVEEIALTSGLNTKNDGASAVVDRIQYRRIATDCWFDDVYVNDTTGSFNNGFSGDTKIIGLLPNAAGNSTQLFKSPNSGSNYDHVDDRPPNDATDYVYSDSLNSNDLYNIPDLSGFSDVQAARLWLRAQKSNAGSGNIATFLSSTGGEYTGPDQALSTAWHYYHEDYDFDPTDSSAWSVSKINAAQIGEKVR